MVDKKKVIFFLWKGGSTHTPMGWLNWKVDELSEVQEVVVNFHWSVRGGACEMIEIGRKTDVWMIIC